MHWRCRRTRKGLLTDATSVTRSPTWRTVAAAILAASLLLLGGIALGRITSPAAASAPASISAEAGFARDMQTHHNQGVELAMIIYEKTDDDAIRTLSYDIASAQGQQSGQMYGWLSVWGVPQAAPEPPMTWMTRPTTAGGDSHDMTDMPTDPSAGPMHRPGDPMPGLATTAQVDDLELASGTDADRAFLTLMIAHHKGAIEMADAVLARSTNRQATSLARGVLSSQAGEIDYMEQLLG